MQELIAALLSGLVGGLVAGLGGLIGMRVAVAEIKRDVYHMGARLEEHAERIRALEVQR